MSDQTIDHNTGAAVIRAHAQAIVWLRAQAALGVHEFDTRPEFAGELVGAMKGLSSLKEVPDAELERAVSNAREALIWVIGELTSELRPPGGGEGESVREAIRLAPRFCDAVTDGRRGSLDCITYFWDGLAESVAGRRRGTFHTQIADACLDSLTHQLESRYDACVGAALFGLGRFHEIRTVERANLRAGSILRAFISTTRPGANNRSVAEHYLGRPAR